MGSGKTNLHSSRTHEESLHLLKFCYPNLAATQFVQSQSTSTQWLTSTQLICSPYTQNYSDNSLSPGHKCVSGVWDEPLLWNIPTWTSPAQEPQRLRTQTDISSDFLYLAETTKHPQNWKMTCDNTLHLVHSTRSQNSPLLLFFPKLFKVATELLLLKPLAEKIYTNPEFLKIPRPAKIAFSNF